MPRVLVIGYGSAGSRHARIARSLGWAVAVADVDLGRLKAAEDDGHEVDRGDGMAKPYPDAVIVATPAEDHARRLRWQQHGVPVFVEKPIALSVGELPRESDVEHVRQVGYQLRLHSAYRWLRGMARDPSLGPVRYARWYAASDVRAWPGRAYGDTLAEFSHEIDLALWTFGPAKPVGAVCADGSWALTLAHDAGTVSHVWLCPRGKTRGVGMVWDSRSAGWDWDSGYYDHPVDAARHPAVRLTTVAAASTWVAPAHALLAEAYERQIECFLGGVVAGEWPSGPATAREAIDVLRICDEARRSCLRSASS